MVFLARTAGARSSRLRRVEPAVQHHGLLAWHAVTRDANALRCARRCAGYIISNFTRRGGPDLLRAGNQGIQHSCILPQIAQLYALTGDRAHLEFCDYIVRRWEASNLRLLSGADRYFSIGCLKAAEMLICYQGLVELYRVTRRKAYVEAAVKYWHCILRTQIGITGNGSISETWWMVGGRPALLTNDIHPNENCVAVCWMKLSNYLLTHSGDAAYADQFEKTLYNHLLGSQALDGSDFSYYQGWKVARCTSPRRARTVAAAIAG